jgi:hypothetical protein
MGNRKDHARFYRRRTPSDKKSDRARVVTQTQLGRTADPRNQHLVENVGASAIQLSDAELAALDRVGQIYE